MKRFLSLMIVTAAVAILAGCASTPPPHLGFVANMSGVEEVPPIRTSAYGTATFHRAGNQLRYKLMVYDIVDVTMAHLHVGHFGENGEHIAWLYPAHPPQKLINGLFSGRLLEGTLKASDLMGPMKGKSIDDLMGKIRSGDVYVNVHTQENPDGEIRGQVR
jgi:hypothetical protein